MNLIDIVTEGAKKLPGLDIAERIAGVLFSDAELDQVPDVTDISSFEKALDVVSEKVSSLGDYLQIIRGDTSIDDFVKQKMSEFSVTDFSASDILAKVDQVREKAAAIKDATVGVDFENLLSGVLNG